MFEKVKQKSKKAKDWIRKNKSDIKIVAYGAVMCITGAVITSVIYVCDNNKAIENNEKYYSKELDVLSMRREANGKYYGHGNGGPTVQELSDAVINSGASEDEQVIGLILYTQK